MKKTLVFVLALVVLASLTPLFSAGTQEEETVHCSCL